MLPRRGARHRVFNWAISSASPEKSITSSMSCRCLASLSCISSCFRIRSSKLRIGWIHVLLFLNEHVHGVPAERSDLLRRSTTNDLIILKSPRKRSLASEHQAAHVDLTPASDVRPDPPRHEPTLGFSSLALRVVPTSLTGRGGRPPADSRGTLKALSHSRQRTTFGSRCAYSMASTNRRPTGAASPRTYPDGTHHRVTVPSISPPYSMFDVKIPAPSV